MAPIQLEISSLVLQNTSVRETTPTSEWSKERERVGKNSRRSVETQGDILLIEEEHWLALSILAQQTPATHLATRRRKKTLSCISHGISHFLSFEENLSLCESHSSSSPLCTLRYLGIPLEVGVIREWCGEQTRIFRLLGRRDINPTPFFPTVRIH